MRLLLVASNQYHKPWPVIPFGACSIAQAADVSGHEVRVLDLNFSSNTAKDIQDAIIPELKKQETDFICLNFANTDMVGHTGIMEAAKKAAEAVDSCLKNVVDTALENNYSSIIIADHGNSETMINPDGSPNTAHTTNPVPIILVEKNKEHQIKNGILGDIAPTVLDLLNIEQPASMTQKTLLK